MILVVGYFGLNHYLNNAADKATQRATIAEAALAQQTSSNAKTEATLAQVTQQYAAIVQSLQAQIASQAVIVAQRQAAVVTQQHVDANLALPELANRLKTLGNAPDGSVLSTGNYVQFTQPAAVAVLQTLEVIPALQANLKDETALAGSAQAAQAQGDKVIAAQGIEITGLKLTITDEEASCKAQVSVVRAEARKGKIKAFKWGVVVGFLGGLFAGSHGL
jgi:hypothetical protein